MSRRFQFNLRSLLGTMLAVALGCSIWVNLPLGAIISGSMVLLVLLSWFCDWMRFSVNSPGGQQIVPRQFSYLEL
jgi:hypothetical protein